MSLGGSGVSIGGVGSLRVYIYIYQVLPSGPFWGGFIRDLFKG